MKTNEQIRAEITAILGDMQVTTAWLRDHGLDAKDPADNEAREILRRIMQQAYAWTNANEQPIAGQPEPS